MGYITTGTPVDPANTDAGSTSSSNFFSDLSGSLSHAHAYNTAQPINQGWPDGKLDGSLGSISNVVASWRVPSLGTAHGQLAIEVEGMASLGNGGTVQFLSSNGNSLTLTFDGVRGFESGTLSISTAGIYDTITMKIVPASVGDQVRVFGVNSAYVQVGSANIDGRRSRVAGSAYWMQPVPTETTPSNHPVSSYLGHAYHSSIGALTRRPRSLVCWSGIPAPGQSKAIKRVDTSNTNRSWIVRNAQGTKAAGQKYTVHAFVKNSAATTKYLGIELVKPEDSQSAVSESTATITIPGNTNIGTWITGSIDLPETGRLPSTFSPFSVHSFTSVAIRHESSVECLSISIWGE